MKDRLALHDLLSSIAGKNVYYQPPSNITMKYPCVVYNRSRINNIHADDSVYYQNNRYDITVISRDSEEPIIDKVSKLQTCSYDRSYTQDNLYHTTFNIFF